MSWMSEWKGESAPSSKQKPEHGKCPHCENKVLIWKVKKDGPNQGRPFFKCDKCETFRWTDTPKCEACEDYTYEAVCRKDGKNYDKPFRACPNKCEGSFEWL
jgi:formate dehydrogenase maturation protein FdhE